MMQVIEVPTHTGRVVIHGGKVGGFTFPHTLLATEFYLRGDEAEIAQKKQEIFSTLERMGCDYAQYSTRGIPKDSDFSIHAVTGFCSTDKSTAYGLYSKEQIVKIKFDTSWVDSLTKDHSDDLVTV